MAANTLLRRQYEAVNKRQAGDPPLTVIDPNGMCDGSLALLTAKQVSGKLGIGVRTFHRWVSSGIFPQAGVRVGLKVVKWECSTVANWVEQTAEKNAGGVKHG